MIDNKQLAYKEHCNRRAINSKKTVETSSGICGICTISNTAQFKKWKDY
jgi:hypothetical protein